VRIHRSDPAGNYFKHLNDTSRYGDLSWAARGYLGEILSRPDGWDETAEAAWKRAQRERGEKSESRRDVQAIWAELKAARFMIGRKVQLPGGKWATEVHVYDRPQPPDLPQGGKSVPPAETCVPPASTDIPRAGKSVRPADTGVLPAADLPQGGKSVSGKSVRPARTGVSAGRTDLPQGGKSQRREKTKRSLSETLELIVTDATDATPDQARETVAAIIEAQQPQTPAAYFRTLAKNGDLDIWLDKTRGRASLITARPDVPDLRPSSVGVSPPIRELYRDPECEHGVPGGTLPIPRTGQPRCALCRVGAVTQESA
jgi:hypothetical protein